MPRMKDDEVRFRHALAESGEKIEDVDLDELAAIASVSPKRARHFARIMAGPKLPAITPQPEAKEEGEHDGDVQG
jgi:hypothetical protein